MINYSVFMMANPQNRDAADKAYAKPQITELVSFTKFVQHIADHNGVFSRGTVKGVIADMCECLVEQLLEGKKVQLGELGNFWISLSSEGAESTDKFTSDKIKVVNIVFTPGPDFENLVGKAEFNLVSSRAAQAATLKAEKAGATTVDLAEAKKKNNSADKGSGSTTGSDTGGGSNTGSDNTGGGSGSGSTVDPGDSGNGDGTVE